MQIVFISHYLASSPSTPPSSLPPDSNPRLECLSQKIDDVMKTFDSHQKENKELRDEINALKGLIQEGRTSARKKKIPSSLSVEHICAPIL